MTRNKKPRFFYGYCIVLAAFLVLTVAGGGFNSFGVFLGPILSEFGWTRAVTSGAYSFSSAIYGLLVMVWGRLSDRFGPRLVLTTAGFFLGLSYLLMSRVTEVWQLYAFFGTTLGIGLSASIIPLLSTVSRWFVRRRGLMTGIVLAGLGAGTIFMPILVGQLISGYGWRMAFVALGIISLVSIIIAAQFLRRDPQSQGQLPNGAIEARPESPCSTASGLFLREAIRTKALWLLWSSYLCMGTCIYGIIVHIVAYATSVGITAISAVNIIAIAGATNILGRFIMGGLVDRIGSRVVLVIALVLMLGALVLLQLSKELWILYLFGAILGFAWSGVVVHSPMIAEFFGLSSHGVLVGFIEIGFMVGVAIGPVLMGHMFDVAGSYKLAFLALTAVASVGLILALLLGRSSGLRLNHSKLGNKGTDG